MQINAWCVMLCLFLQVNGGFSFVRSIPSRSPRTFSLHSSSSKAPERVTGASQWLREYKTASGEVVNPYEVLKIRRSASTQEVRQSYISLSRRYHPDGAMQRSILPGSCNNWDEVRDEWERIKLSYEILKHPQRRKRYDRHEAIADPGAALRRAATDAAVTSIVKFGQGVFNFSSFAVGTLVEKVQQQQKHQQT